MEVDMKMFFSVFLTLWTCSASSPPDQIECMVVNLEYMNCTWNGNGTQSGNLSFKSSYKSRDSSQTDPVECASYLHVGALRVGCLVPYSEEKLLRFRDFYAWLYRDDIIIAKQEYTPLSKRVKLHPPHNVSWVLRDPELWIYWNISSNIKFMCQEREVRYRINGNQWNDQGRVMENAFNVPFPNAQKRYDFQVRVRMSSNCAQSDLWSDWSELVSWGTTVNDTVLTTQTSTGLMVLYTIGAAVVLIMLTCLLIHSERLRVILVPVVPSPKNLGDLIDSYNGNVEKWLHISKELQDGFKPNFSERPCTVREFRTETHSESESDDCLSVHTAVSSDYQSMQSYSSTSTLPSPTDSPSTETTPLNGM
ncbi:interleukin 2 receptor, gamma a [Clarias gariepinus]|uniref:interleukin 2 receptor, gamma a n=1 Tax=Clarias gariepinus TaxID=13013 RepID=UPI00234E3486|nr:interleukin 2 receptor, gamma a [Clarias gariepinus]